jgi:Xaa-Pro aminopeptidase
LALLVLMVEAEERLLVCDIEASTARAQSDVPEVEEYVEFAEDPIATLAALLVRMLPGGGRLGVEGRRLSHSAGLELGRRIPRVELVAIDDEVEAIQTLKAAAEAEELGAAARGVLATIERAVGDSRPGMTEAEVAGEMAAGVAAAGGALNFLAFGAGAQATLGHPIPTTRRLEDGEIWRVDIGARFDELVSADIARCGVVGEPTDRQEAVLRGLRAAQSAGIAAVEPGRPAREVFAAVKAEFGRQGLPFAIPHVGHGLGIGLHEYPALQPADETPLAAGMVLNVEPLLLLPDLGEGYHVEDLVLVTDEGPRLLTEPQEALLRLAGRDEDG